MSTSNTKSAIGMSLMTVLSRITGLFRITAIAAALGMTISRVSDAYNLAFQMPNQVYELALGGILTSVFIPVFVENKTKKSPEAAWDAANRILTLALILLVGMTVVCWIFTPFLVRIQSLTGAADFRKQAEFFFYFFAPSIIFFGLSAIFSGMLNTYRLFFIPAFTPVLNNVLMITVAVLYYFYPDKVGLTGLALGTTLGVAIMAFAQIPALYKLGWRYHWKLDLKDPSLQKFFALAAPMLLYVGLNQLAITIRNNYATSIPGGFAAMSWGFTFFQLPYGIFSVSITTVLYPTLSKHAVDMNWDKFRENMSQGIRWSTYVIVPCAVGYLCLSEPIIRIIMERGKFHAGDTNLLAKVLMCYSVALLPYTITLLFTRSFYALQDTRTPTWVTLIGVILTVIGCSLFVKKYGVPGVAMAYGMQYYGMVLVLGYLLRRKIKRLDGKRIAISIGKSLFSASIMGVCLYFLARYITALNWQGFGILQHPFFRDVFLLGVTILTGGIIYLASTSLLRMDEFHTMKNWFIRGEKIVE